MPKPAGPILRSYLRFPNFALIWFPPTLALFTAADSTARAPSSSLISFVVVFCVFNVTLLITSHVKAMLSRPFAALLPGAARRHLVGAGLAITWTLLPTILARGVFHGCDLAWVCWAAIFVALFSLALLLVWFTPALGAAVAMVGGLVLLVFHDRWANLVDQYYVPSWSLGLGLIPVSIGCLTIVAWRILHFKEDLREFYLQIAVDPATQAWLGQHARVSSWGPWISARGLSRTYPPTTRGRAAQWAAAMGQALPIPLVMGATIPLCLLLSLAVGARRPMLTQEAWLPVALALAPVVAFVLIATSLVARRRFWSVELLRPQSRRQLISAIGWNSLATGMLAWLGAVAACLLVAGLAQRRLPLGVVEVRALLFSLALLVAVAGFGLWAFRFQISLPVVMASTFMLAATATMLIPLFGEGIRSSIAPHVDGAILVATCVLVPLGLGLARRSYGYWLTADVE